VRGVRLRLSLVAVLAVVACGVSAEPAAASAFYNESESGQPNPAQLDFSCGIFCHNSWNISVGDSASRPGEGGSFLLDNGGGFTGQSSEACDTGGGHPDVQDHGWAELHYLGGAYQWRMYGSDQSPISGSPFALQFGTFHGLSPGPPGCY
jgi:hypothetical protein